MDSLGEDVDQNIMEKETDLEFQITEDKIHTAVTSNNLWPPRDEACKTLNTESGGFSVNEISLDTDMQSSKDFMVGSKVKVCDYLDIYHEATIMEVDYDESEIFLHYDDISQKQDEWISTYSTRLSRSLSKGQTLTHAIKPDPSQMLQAPKRLPRKKSTKIRQITKRRKRINKVNCVVFAPGERCLASWGSTGRFQATVRKVLDFDKYEVIFDDGIVKAYKGTSLKKLKQNRKFKRPSSVKSNAYGSAPTPQQSRVVLSDVLLETPVVFHRHLFDPNLDYLGSKKERREMKRKLNVKDLFSFKKRPIEKISQSTTLRKKQPPIKKIKRRPHTMDGGESSSKPLPKKKMKRTKAVERAQKVSSPVPSVSAIIYEPDPIPELKAEEVKEEPVLAPGEWCCKWLNGQPVGVVSEIEVSSTVADAGESNTNSAPPLARRSVQVDDYRIPPGWSKHMVRRSIGCSAGKWDVVLVCPEGHRFRTKSEMKLYLDENNRRQELSAYEVCLLDFGVHRKRSRQMGWDVTDPTAVGFEGMPVPLPAGNSPTVNSPITKSIKRRPRLTISKPHKKEQRVPFVSLEMAVLEPESLPAAKWENIELTNVPVETLEDGYVYVGSCKVQVIDNLLRCPAEGCLKNFRKDNLLQMHIKHYHRELTSLLGITPKVADLAYARCQTVRYPIEEPSTPKPHKLPKELKLKIKKEALKMDILSEYDSSQQTLDEWNAPKAPNKSDHYSSTEDLPRIVVAQEIDKKHLSQQPKQDEIDSQNSENKFQTQFPAFRETVSSSPRLERILTEKDALFAVSKMEYLSSKSQSPVQNQQLHEADDIENVIKVHTVSKHSKHRRLKSDRKSDKRKSLGNFSFKDIPKKKKRHSTGGSASKPPVAGEVWEPYPLSPDETRSSFDNPDLHGVSAIVAKETKPEENIQTPMFITEGGEKIRIVHMKREEIINCACGYNEEDGLMIQCELCLCWQHAVCHSIETESQVPEKYICYICLNPRRGRRSQRFLHDQSWLYEGVLPTWKGVASVTDPAETTSRASALKKSFELSGNLYLIAQALHAIKIKMHVARKKDHPKLYLWSKPWDPPANRLQHNVIVEQMPDLSMMPKLHLNSMMGKENSCPVTLKVEDIKSVMKIDPPDINQMKNPMSSDDGGDTQAVTASSDELSKGTDGQLSAQGSASNLLVNFLASPGGTSIDLPISTTEFETLAKSVQVECETRACESQPVVPMFPEPEAAIDLVKCREQLHEHVSKALAAFDVRLDSIEAQIAELESQDPSLEDDETAEYCPRTKQTIQMLLRDLETMEELARIT